MNHRISALLIIVPLAAVVLAATVRQEIVAAGKGRTGRTYSRPQLEYLKAVNRTMPPKDPQLLFVLMAEFSSANQQEEGVGFLTERLREFEPRLSDTQKALYLSAISVLRAQHANDVLLLHRIAYVRDTIGMLDRAQQLSDGDVFIVNYLAGNIRAQLPARFNQQQKAREELAWCAANAEKAPNRGYLREVYYQQAKLAQAANEPEKAQEYLRLSGYRDLNRPLAFNTAFAEDTATGHTFVPRRISEPVPGRVYALSGFEFTEYYFVVSDDGRELIGIDAGTRPDSAKGAYEALRAYAPGVPALTTVFVTHAHWDHVGGFSFLSSLNPRPRFYARSNYEEELTRSLNAPPAFEKNFFGERFDMADVRRFKPDVTVDRPTELRVGGTRVSLIPIPGGETSDGLFIHLPDAGILFAGDFIMPYLGAPPKRASSWLRPTNDGTREEIFVNVRRGPGKSRGASLRAAPSAGPVGSGSGPAMKRRLRSERWPFRGHAGFWWRLLRPDEIKSIKAVPSETKFEVLEDSSQTVILHTPS